MTMHKIYSIVTQIYDQQRSIYIRFNLMYSTLYTNVAEVESNDDKLHQ